MQALIPQAQIFSASMAYIIKDSIAAKHAPKKIYQEMHDEEALKEAYQDAKKAGDALFNMGQQAIISCMMEALEAASWQLSPSQDMDDHIAMIHDLFQEMMEMEIEEDASDDADDQDSLAWQKSMLENCLAASAG